MGGMGGTVCFDGGVGGGGGSAGGGGGGAMDMSAAIFDDLGKLDDPMWKLLDGSVGSSGVMDAGIIDPVTEEHLKS